MLDDRKMAAVNAFKFAAMPATFPSNEQSRAIVLSGRSGCLPLPNISIE